MRPLFERFRQRGATAGYPVVAEPAPSIARGFPALDPALCRGHAACAASCPTGAIRVEDGASGGWRWSLDLGRCVACGRCAEVCPTEALRIDPAYEFVYPRREDLVRSVTFQATSADPLPRPAEALRVRIHTIFGRSLHIRHLDVGSDNGADWEMATLLGPVYDVQRLGIDFVASPRHADMLLVTGAVSRNLAPALTHTYEATPEPRLVVALGTDACGGGITQGSYAAAGGVDRVIPVDYYIPGDPPRPQAIIHGLLVALGRRVAVAATRDRVVAIPGPQGGGRTWKGSPSG